MIFFSFSYTPCQCRGVTVLLQLCVWYCRRAIGASATYVLWLYQENLLSNTHNDIKYISIKLHRVGIEGALDLTLIWTDISFGICAIVIYHHGDYKVLWKFNNNETMRYCLISWCSFSACFVTTPYTCMLPVSGAYIKTTTNRQHKITVIPSKSINTFHATRFRGNLWLCSNCLITEKILKKNFNSQKHV